jgi:hypothetical protein
MFVASVSVAQTKEVTGNNLLLAQYEFSLTNVADPVCLNKGRITLQTRKRELICTFGESKLYLVRGFIRPEHTSYMFAGTLARELADIRDEDDIKALDDDFPVTFTIKKVKLTCIKRGWTFREESKALTRGVNTFRTDCISGEGEKFLIAVFSVQDKVFALVSREREEVFEKHLAGISKKK